MERPYRVVMVITNIVTLKTIIETVGSMMSYIRMRYIPSDYTYIEVYTLILQLYKGTFRKYC